MAQNNKNTIILKENEYSPTESRWRRKVKQMMDDFAMTKISINATTIEYSITSTVVPVTSDLFIKGINLESSTGTAFAIVENTTTKGYFTVGAGSRFTQFLDTPIYKISAGSTLSVMQISSNATNNNNYVTVVGYFEPLIVNLEP